MGEAKWSGGRLVTGVDLRRALSRQVQRVVTEMEMDDNVSDGKGWPDGEEGGNAQTGPKEEAPTALWHRMRVQTRGSE
jgi:hypothetical protein